MERKISQESSNEESMIPVQIGRRNKLRVKTWVSFGVYLDGREYGDILMPMKYVPDDCEVDNFVDVFLYLDSEDRFVATTETPLAMASELAFLKVASTTSTGAFLDWGLPKDLLVPFREQKQKMIKDNFYMVYIYFDEKSDRLAASSKIHKYLQTEISNFNPGDEVDLIICNKFELGFNVIIDKKATGVLYDNEIFQELGRGQFIKGFIKNIRNDEKIDVSLQKMDKDYRDSLEEKILVQLKQEGGFLPLTDKSPPEAIYSNFQVSKKAFKKAVGALYKKRKIKIEEDGLRKC